MAELAKVVPLRPGVERAPRVRSVEEPWVSKQVCAAHFGVDRRTVDRWVARGMPFDVQGGRRRFKVSRCEMWLRVQGNGRHIPVSE